MWWIVIKGKITAELGLKGWRGWENKIFSLKQFHMISYKETTCWIIGHWWTRPDTRLPKSRAGGQGQWWNWPTKQLGRSSNPQTARKRQKKLSVTNGPTDRLTDRAGCRVACTRLKRERRAESWGEIYKPHRDGKKWEGGALTPSKRHELLYASLPIPRFHPSYSMIIFDQT